MQNIYQHHYYQNDQNNYIQPDDTQRKLSESSLDYQNRRKLGLP